MSAQHEITDACAEVHCFSHNVDEAQTGWLVCGECMHVFPSAGALRRDWRREYWRVASMEGVSPPIPLWRRIRTAATVRASRVTFCPHCLHDFSWMPPRRRYRTCCARRPALMRDVHKPGHCPNADAWHHAAGLVERVAAAEETGAPLRARERDAALRIAGTFLTTHEQTEVDAS